MQRPPQVTIVEVGPRDGLQNEARIVALDDKVRFVELLAIAGLAVIEVSAFVSPARVPQLGDAGEVFRRLTRRQGVRYTALVPNLKGLERALEAGVAEIAIFAAASDTFSRRNINQDIEQSLATYRHVCTAAAAAGVPVRGYLSTCFGCPYEGDVPIPRVVELTGRLLELGVVEVSVSDTIGVAHPGQVHAVLDELLRQAPLERLALHFHDTRGTALANVYAALGRGIRTFDASCGGLGGCPFAPGAAGNLATEDLVYLLDGLGVRTGVALPALLNASAFIERHVGHPLPSRYAQAVRATSGESDRRRS